MCIAIGKPKGVELPSKDIFETCFINNDDGSGFAFAHNGKVIVKKGYMKFEDFYNALMDMDSKYNLKNLGCLFHFRIATHGARDGSMTHPFPIVSDDGALKKIEYVSDYAIVHNGVISLTSSVANKSDGLSDTAIFVRDYLSNIAQNKNWFKKRCNLELIEKLIESKMAILDKYGNIKMTDGFVCDNGVYYSNTTYKYKYTYTYTKNYGFKSPYSYGYYGGYGYEDDGYDDYATTDKQTSLTEIKIPLMKIPNGYTIGYSGGFDEVVDDEKTKSEYWADSDFNIYWSDWGVPQKERDYFMMGQAKVYDKNGQEVTFKSNILVDDYQLDYDDNVLAY